MNAPDRAALLERAAYQELHYDERASRSFQRRVVAEACAEVGADPARAARRWASSRNADIYRIEGEGASWLLKILISKPARTLECEYGQLEALHRLAGECGLFRTPEPRRLFAERSAYLMRFVEGRTLAARMTGGTDAAELGGEASQCGRALAAVHAAWASPPTPCDVRALLHDFSHLPWRPGSVEVALLGRVFDALDGVELPACRLYLDFDPVNVLSGGGTPPVLLDAPERVAIDAPHWDLGIFLLGLRRVAWRRPLAARGLAALAARMRQDFLQGYAGSSAPPGGRAGALMAGLAELARVGQLWRWWLAPLAFRHRATGIARAAYAWPLLRAERSRVLGELDRLLESGRG